MLSQVLDHPIFKGVDQDSLGPFVAGLRTRTYATGRTVSRPDASWPVMHLVLKGRLCLFELTPDGRRVILGFIEAGGVDGMMTITGMRGHFSVAVMPTEVVMISPALIGNMIHADPRFAINLLRAAGERVQEREEHILRNALRRPQQRLAAQLLALVADRGADGGWATAPRISHEALGDMLGLRRETVTLHMGRMRRNGLVGVRGDRFTLDVTRLMAVRDGFDRAKQPEARAGLDVC